MKVKNIYYWRINKMKLLKEQPTPAAPAEQAPTATPEQAAPAGTAKNQSAAAKNLSKKLDANQALQKLIPQITKVSDASALLAQLAQKLGGDKMAADKALKAALVIVQKQGTLEESHRRIEDFVSYLFN